MLSLETSEI